MKTCAKCAVTKPVEQFHRNRSSSDGRVNRCKACVASYARTYRSENLEKLRDYNHGYRKNNPSKARFWKYGLEHEEYVALLDKYDNCCHLCRQPLRAGHWTHVDHCHDTDRVRGVLCRPCNVALGALGDNEAGLLRALSYIRGES